jgi:Putative bacterial sensory transduction regulator
LSITAHLRSIFLVVLMVACAPFALAHPPPPAPEIYYGISMEDMGEVLLLEGLSFSQIAIDGKGIVANRRFDVADGVQWSVLGYDCAREQACAEIQLRAVFKAPAGNTNTLQQINQWNASNRFTRAYSQQQVIPMRNVVKGAGPQGIQLKFTYTNLILEMDIYLSGGQSLKNIRQQIAIWRQSVRRFSSTLTPEEKKP